MLARSDHSTAPRSPEAPEREIVCVADRQRQDDHQAPGTREGARDAGEERREQAQRDRYERVRIGLVLVQTDLKKFLDGYSAIGASQTERAPTRGRERRSVPAGRRHDADDHHHALTDEAVTPG